MSAAAAISAAQKAHLNNMKNTLKEGSAGLSCDGNLVPLVVFLFLAGWFLFSSLRTGVQTTRVVVRLAREGCRDGRRKNVMKENAASTVVQMGFQWAKACVTLSGSLMPNRAALSRRLKSIRRTKTSSKITPVTQWSPLKRFVLTYCIPYRIISMVWGLLTRVPLPFAWMKHLLYGTWATSFNCKLDEMRFPLEQYPTLCSFFLRPLKDGVRKVDMTPTGMVSPVDGKVLHVASGDLCDYENVVLEQVKGLRYPLKEFLGETPARFKSCTDGSRKLNTVVLYLSPGDYHHFHSACEATFTERKHFPGALLPVKPVFAEQVPGLYCINERVVLNGSWSQGFFSYVAVGALNVGSIEIAFDADVVTNVMSKTSGCFTKEYSPAIDVVRAERIGAFNLGSTVVLIFESDKDFEFDVHAGDVVTVGQRLDKPQEGKEEPDTLPILCPPWPAAN